MMQQGAAYHSPPAAGHYHAAHKGYYHAARKRSVWAIASAIYHAIAGVFNILAGLAALVAWGLILDLLNRLVLFGPLPPVTGFSIELPNILAPATIGPILIGIITLIFGVASLAVAFGLINMQGWARVAAVGLHGVYALLALVQVVLLIGTGWLGASFVPFINLIVNLALLVGLLLPATVSAFQGYRGGSHHHYQHQPAACPPPDPCPPPAYHLPPGHPPVYAQQPQAAAQPQFQAHPGTPPTQLAQPAGVASTEVAGAAPAVLAWVVELSGPRSGRQHRIASQLTIGRNPDCCDLVLDDAKVSGMHARIRVEQGQFVLYDLGSTNRTFVNGTPVVKQPLQDNDQIALGPNTRLAFVRVPVTV